MALANSRRLGFDMEISWAAKKEAVNASALTAFHFRTFGLFAPLVWWIQGR